MLIITGTIITVSTNNLKTKNLSNLYTDLKSLDDKIAVYYNKYGTLPLKEKFMGSYNFKTVANPNDDPEEYYIIDINKLESLILTKKLTWTENDVYIINTKTHTVYYPEGVTLDGEKFYRLPGEYSKIEEEEIKIELNVKTKTETSITVSATEGNSAYQFSIDGKTWTEPQESNEYTYNNLAKTVVVDDPKKNNSSFYENKGVEYTIYLKCKDKNNKEQTASVTTKLPVEIQISNNKRYFFTYEEIGDEIRITGRKKLTEGLDQYAYIGSISQEDDTLLIPSYINGKPVTEISANLFKAISVDELKSNKEYYTIPYVNYACQKPIYAKSSETEGILFSQIAQLRNDVDRFITIGEYGVGHTTVDLSKTQDGDSVDVNVYGALKNIVIPPTVKRIVEETKSINVQSIANYNVKTMSLVGGDITLINVEVINVEVQGKIQKGEKIGTGETWDYYPVYVKILGKQTKEEIENINLADEINGTDAKYKINYECIY